MVLPGPDPYRTAGPGTYRYGYVFAWDEVLITVTHNPALCRCRMRVELASSLAETKEIQAFNFFNDTWADQVDSTPDGAVRAMTISKRMPADGCGVGTDTVVLARATQFGPRAFYTFPRGDFWDFWGGCTVRFDWFWDEPPNFAPIAPSGAQTPAPTYPLVQAPDGTLMQNATGQGLRIVFGGTDFPVDPGYLRMGVRSRAFPANPPIPFFQLPAFPARPTTPSFANGTVRRSSSSTGERSSSSRIRRR